MAPHKFVFLVIIIFFPISPVCSQVRINVPHDYYKIQTAIDASESGDSIIVSPGFYQENISFNGKNILVGSLFLTTQDTSYISSTIIDGGGLKTTVLFNKGETNSAILCGFKVQNGFVTKGIDEDSRIGEHWSGAGITVLSGSSPSIKSCIITGNNGSGIRISKEWNETPPVSAIIENCLFHSNNVIYNENDPRGGTVTLGGVIALDYNGYTGNSGNDQTATVFIKNSKIFGNTLMPGFSGGGIYAYKSEFSITNAIIYNNGGVGIIIQDEVPGVQEIINSTIVDNSNKGIIASAANQQPGTSNPIIKNSIIWGNSESIYSSLITTEVTFSNIQGGYTGTGNIDAFPYFKDDYSLLDYSVAIGAGTSFGAPTTDIDGDIRPNPSGSSPDMGAYENPLSFPKILFNEEMCLYDTLELTYAGILTDNMRLIWSFPDASFVDTLTDIKTPKVKWNNYGNKTIKVTVLKDGIEMINQEDSVLIYNTPTSSFSIDKLSLCILESALISFTGNNTPGAEYVWDFNAGNIISGTGQGDYQVNWSSSGLKTISLTVSDNGCSSDTSINIFVNQQTQSIPICMVSVDSSNHNMVVWEMPNENPYDLINIYKQTSHTNAYEKIGSQSADSISVFVDSLSNPAQSSSRYRISILDTCGYESEQSDFHKTLHLTINTGIGGAWNLIWDGYEGFDYSNYNIYRGTSDNNLLKIAEQASNTFTFTDLAPPIGTVYYQIEIINPNPCNTSMLKSGGNYFGTTRSNMVTSNYINGINDEDIKNIKIWPNPANSILYINSDLDYGDVNISILSLEGKVLIFKQNNVINEEIDISNIKRGMYLILLEKDEIKITRELIIL